MGKDLFNERINRFGLRKLSVGVCSVMLGTLVMTGVAAADEVEASEAKADTTVIASEKTEEKKAEATYAAPAAATPAKEDQANEKVAEAKTEEKATTETAAPAATTAPAGSLPDHELTKEEADAILARQTADIKAAEEKKALVEKKAETPANSNQEIKESATASYASELGKKHSAAMPRDPRNGQALPTGTGFRADTTTTTNHMSETGVQAGLEDAKADTTETIPEFTADTKKAFLNKQLAWVDFGDTAAWTDIDTIDGKPALKVGSTYHKEILPGYIVTLKVKSLKPFEASDIFRQRLEEQGASDLAKSVYDPNAIGKYLKGSAGYNQISNKNEEARVVAEVQSGQWSELKKAGIYTGTKAKTSLVSQRDGGNWGAQFEVSATYKGTKVNASVIMADAESANDGEFFTMTTNGQGWQVLAEFAKNNSKAHYLPQTKDKWSIGSNNGSTLKREATDAWKEAYNYFVSPDSKTAGLGSQVFGPNVSSGNYSVPVMVSVDATEVGMYITSTGKQAAMIGFMLTDMGDAPESYGQAIHSIGGINTDLNSSDYGKVINHPYLGDEPADPETTSTNGNWTNDDKLGDPDEGIDQLLPDGEKQLTNGIIKADRTTGGNYTLTVKASANGNGKAYIKAWADFNGNGVFDEEEESETLEVGEQGNYTVQFKNIPAKNDESFDKIGVRVRIALEADEIEGPTGMAFSGEVEDFQAQITYPPRGDKQETTGAQGVTQTATVHFKAYGVAAYNYDDKAKIDQTIAPKIVLADGSDAPLDAQGYYVVAGEGKYKVTGAGDDVSVEFIPEKTFVGTAKGITIRRTDTNKATTGWYSKDRDEENGLKAISDQTNMMDGRYIPTVTKVTPTASPAESTGKQGETQTGTPTFTAGDKDVPIDKSTIKLLDASGKEVTETEAKDPSGNVVGKYVMNADGTVNFVPTNKLYTGEVVAANVVAADTNGTKVQTTYTPHITPVTPTGEDVTSTGKQGQAQTGTPKFTEGAPVAPITINEKQPAKLIDPATGKATDATSIDAKDANGNVVGSYTINPLTGEVTFQPNKDFVGTPVPATVEVKDANGTAVTAKYTPTVTPVEPKGEDVTSTGKQGQEQSETPKFTAGDDSAPITINADQPAKFIDPATGKETDKTELPAMKDGKKVGTYTIDPLTGKVTFKPNKDFVGTPDGITVQVKDSNGTPATAKYTPTVEPVEPKGEDVTSTGKQGQEQSETPKFTAGDDSAPITINADQPAKFIDPTTGEPTDATELPAMKDGKKVGTYTIDPLTGKVTFKPNADFVGTPDGITVQVKDSNGTPATAKYTPTVEPVEPTATPAESTAPQGVEQSGTPTFTEGDPTAPIDKSTIKLVDEEGNAVDSIPAKSPSGEVIGTYTVEADGSIKFTPTNKLYTGEVVPAKVQAQDTNGTKVETTYTPHITPVEPTGEDVTSTGKQGQTQTGKPVFTEGDPLVPIDETVAPTFEDGSTEKVVPGEGKYTIDADGNVTFTPEPQFTGTAKGVTVVRKDKNGTSVSAKYTPTVEPVTPTATPAETTGKQGATQEGEPTFTQGDSTAPIKKDSITLLDEKGNPAAEVEAKDASGKVVGKFTYDATTGKVIFTPTDKTYTGDVVPVKIQAQDANGTKVETTYTVHITPVIPTGADVTSTGKQGATQTGKPVFTSGDALVAPIDELVLPTFEDGTTEKVVPGEGTYTIDKDGNVTFKPEPQFTGEAKGVTVVRKDTNGTKVTAKYTPTVTPVTPTGEDTTSTGKQGQEQSGKPTFTAGDPTVEMDDSVPATFEDGSTEKVIPGEGTYTVAPDGTVTFKPEKGFTGTGTGVTVVRVDKNGTKATAKYTPTVTPVTPTAEPATSINIVGKTQTGKPVFTAGDEAVPMDDNVPATFEDGSTVKVVPGEGTYSVAADGTVTFTPEEGFVGTAKGVVVVRKDINGTEAKASYTPTVVAASKGIDDATSGKQGEQQTGKPSFEGDIDETIAPTFEDGSTEKVVPGEGTYVLNPDGTVTFTPEPGFTGTAKGVVVVRKDKYGNDVKATYTPTVIPNPAPTPQPQPVKPEAPKEEHKPVYMEGAKELPKTGEESSTSAVALSVLAAISALGLAGGRRKKKED